MGYWATTQIGPLRKRRGRGFLIDSDRMSWVGGLHYLKIVSLNDVRLRNDSRCWIGGKGRDLKNEPEGMRWEELKREEGRNGRGYSEEDFVVKLESTRGPLWGFLSISYCLHRSMRWMRRKNTLSHLFWYLGSFKSGKDDTYFQSKLIH